jgi:hypothetical protein
MDRRWFDGASTVVSAHTCFAERNASLTAVHTREGGWGGEEWVEVCSLPDGTRVQKSPGRRTGARWNEWQVFDGETYGEGIRPLADGGEFRLDLGRRDQRGRRKWTARARRRLGRGCRGFHRYR